MSNQSLIEKIGFEATDKVVIFHIDDVGFSHSSNVASFECLDFGVASCGSVIVPAPWFLEAAEICRKNPKYDIGVHLTLTCEYDLYRWRALSSVDPESGLLDSERSLWRTSEEAVQHINPKEAEAEMRLQIQTALDNGINITHIDTHMGTVMDTRFLPFYLKMAREFNVPAFIPRVTEEELIALGFEQYVAIYSKMLAKLEAEGVPLLDHVVMDTLNEQPDKEEYYCNLFAEIEPGLTHFLFHAAKMSPELQAITPDSASARNQDYEAFTNQKLRECAEKNDLKIIGYKELRDCFNK
jgi:predicted glycoside hydrolase/deacetylase ChbG (UPF0249 family)